MSDFLLIAGRTGPDLYYYNPTVLTRYCQALLKKFTAADPPRGFSRSTYAQTLALLPELAVRRPQRGEFKATANDIFCITELFALFARSFLIASRSDDTITEETLLPEMALALGLQFAPLLKSGGEAPIQRSFEAIFTPEEKRWLTGLVDEATQPGPLRTELCNLFQRTLVVFHVQVPHYHTLAATTDGLDTPPARWEYVEQAVQGAVELMVNQLGAEPTAEAFQKVEQMLFNHAVFWASLRRNFPDFARRYLV